MSETREAREKMLSSLPAFTQHARGEDLDDNFVFSSQVFRTPSGKEFMVTRFHSWDDAIKWGEAVLAELKDAAAREETA